VAKGRRLRAQRDGRAWPVAYDAPANVIDVPEGATVDLSLWPDELAESVVE
jgi:hypothetical protein